MCSSPECRVEVLPDGSVDEYHQFSHEDLVNLMKRVKEMCWDYDLVRYAHAFPLNHSWEEVPNGKSWADPQGVGSTP